MVIPITTISELSPFSRDQFADNVRHLLKRMSNERPNATEVCNLFLFYCQVLESSIANDISTLVCPSYSDWKEIVTTYQDPQDKLYALADLFAKTGEKTVSMALQTRLLNHDAKLRYEAKIHDADKDFCFEDCLVEVSLERGNGECALETYRAAIKNDALNFWWWHKLCNVYLRLDNLDGAIEFCHKRLAEDLDNPTPSLTLANLYATKLDFANAIMSFHNFAVICDRLSYSKDANVLFKQELKLDLFETQERYTSNNLTLSYRTDLLC